VLLVERGLFHCLLRGAEPTGLEGLVELGLEAGILAEESGDAVRKF